MQEMRTNIVSFYTAMQNVLHPEEAREELTRAQREFIQACSLVKIVVGFCNDGKGFRPALFSLKQSFWQYCLPLYFAEILFQ